MSKYHKGDKFIVEIKEVIESDNGRLYRSEFSTLTFDDYGLDKLQKVESSANQAVMQAEAYNKGLNDAWELAYKLLDMKFETRVKVFGAKEIMSILTDFTPQEALLKLEEYKNQIKVGEILEAKINGTKCVVSSDKGCDDYVLTFSDGSGSARSLERIKKDFTRTGKHIDIQSILQQIGGGTSES